MTTNEVCYSLMANLFGIHTAQHKNDCRKYNSSV